MIQQRGMLLAASRNDSNITWVSDNSKNFCGAAPSELLGKSLTDFVTEKQVDSLFAVAKKEKPLTVPVTFFIGDKRYRFNCLTYMSGDCLVLELEPLGLESESDSSAKNLQLARLLKWERGQKLKGLLQTLVDGVAALTEFDKVMLYRFHSDWHGEVVAETNTSKLPDYLGLHFPASDIPAPARQLFRTNWVRQISDVNFPPSNLIARAGADNLELWISGLRAAAPVHIEYLQNMGVAASLTLSLMCEGELWGLIACHHTLPKATPLWTRSMCEILAKAASFQITKSVARETEVAQLQSVQAFDNLQMSLINAPDPATFFSGERDALCALTKGSDCLLIIDGKVLPSSNFEPSLLAPLVKALGAVDSSHVITDSLHTFLPEAENFPSYCGMLACRLNLEKNSWLVWFRPECKQTISWGGDPQKDTRGEIGKNHPRASFHAFLQQVTLKSKEWETIHTSFGRNLSFLLSQKLLGQTVSLEATAQPPSTYLVNLLADMSAPINQAINSLSALIKNAATTEDKEMLTRVLDFHQELRNTIDEFVIDVA